MMESYIPLSKNAPSLDDYDDPGIRYPLSLGGHRFGVTERMTQAVLSRVHLTGGISPSSFISHPDSTVIGGCIPQPSIRRSARMYEDNDTPGYNPDITDEIVRVAQDAIEREATTSLQGATTTAGTMAGLLRRKLRDAPHISHPPTEGFSVGDINVRVAPSADFSRDFDGDIVNIDRGRVNGWLPDTAGGSWTHRPVTTSSGISRADMTRQAYANEVFPSSNPTGKTTMASIDSSILNWIKQNLNVSVILNQSNGRVEATVTLKLPNGEEICSDNDFIDLENNDE